jgi:hypothetical protein
VHALRATPTSAAKLAEQFCEAMIDNLRYNVGEQKKRLARF